jgi:hypothetical protein
MAFDKAKHQAEVRAKFASLNQRVEEIRSISTPLREKRDEVVRGHRAEEEKLIAEIAAVEDGLFDIEQERAMWARQLEGNRNIAAEAMGPDVADEA